MFIAEVEKRAIIQDFAYRYHALTGDPRFAPNALADLSVLAEILGDSRFAADAKVDLNALTEILTKLEQERSQS